MGWFGGETAGGCNGGTPCFCTGSFTDFQVTFSGVAYNSWTFELASTLCGPLGGADHINGTHTIALGSSALYTALACSAVKELDGGSLGDAVKPVQWLKVVQTGFFANRVITATCECDEPLKSYYLGPNLACSTWRLWSCDAPVIGNWGGTWDSYDPFSTSAGDLTYVQTDILYVDGSNVTLRVTLGWPEVQQTTGEGQCPWTGSPFEQGDYVSVRLKRAWARWEKTIAIKACTSINESLTLTDDNQGICDTLGSASPYQNAPCTAWAGDGTFDFSSASCSLALV